MKSGTCKVAPVAMVAGFALQWVGFVPNAEQTAETKDMISSLKSFVPVATIAIGALIFTRFRLTESEHASIRERLAKRSPS